MNARALLIGLVVLGNTQLTATAGVAPFNTLGVVADVALNSAQLPYTYPTTCTLACGGPTDVYGVRVFVLNGITYQHPVGQAQLALALLRTYRLNHDVRYLTRAIRNAQRLVDVRVEAAGAWFYPYGFNFAVYGDTARMLRAPWFSALAQAQALSAFTRLFNVTGDPAWMVAADATFASLIAEPVVDQPWVSWVDANGYLWLEEYPRWPVQDSERVLNGTIFAAFGLYDYMRLTGNLTAAQMFDATVTTVEHYFASWRAAGGPAYYSLAHKRPNIHYHPVVVAELRCLAKLTRRAVESSMAWQLYQDYPATRYLLCGTV